MAADDARPRRARTKTIEEAPAAPGRKRRTALTSRSRRRAEAPPADAVALHAYLLWERGEPGDALTHWLQAERELAA